MIGLGETTVLHACTLGRTVYGLPPGEAVTEFRDAFTTARSE